MKKVMGRNSEATFVATKDKMDQINLNKAAFCCSTDNCSFRHENFFSSILPNDDDEGNVENLPVEQDIPESEPCYANRFDRSAHLLDNVVSDGLREVSSNFTTKTQVLVKCQKVANLDEIS